MSALGIPGLGFILLLLLTRATPAFPTASRSVTQSDLRECARAVSRFLGGGAQVAKCGYLTGGNFLETVGIEPLRPLSPTREGVAAAALVILRREAPGWKLKLRADKTSIRNQLGYLAPETWNSSERFFGYRVLFLGEGVSDVPGFALELFFLGADGNSRGTPVEIMWNPEVARFQEYSQYEDPASFQPEAVRSRRGPRRRGGASR